MLRSRKKRSRSARYPRHWPFVVMWVLGILLSAWMLLALAYVIGRPAPKSSTAIPDALLAAAESPGTALAVAVGAALLGAWCVRHTVLHWLAWKPGRIEVSEFAGGSSMSQAQLTQNTVKFRRMLATLRLQAPAPVPGAAPEGDFLDVLGRRGVDSRNVLGTLFNVLRAAVPTHSYEIHGVLQERDEGRRCEVTIQVVQLPSQTSLPVTASESDWDTALQKAADDATAMILPRTRHCRAPWGAWRGYVMPPGLLHAYEEATGLEQDRRYDEALDRYFAAAEKDPMNMVLRLRLGQLQERMGLYVDALTTYSGMLAAGKPAGVRLPWLRYRGRGRRERRRALHIARYRRNVLLGGRALADQWVRPFETPKSKRDLAKVRLRARLREHLRQSLIDFGESEGAPPRRIRETAEERDRRCAAVKARVDRALSEPSAAEAEWVRQGQPSGSCQVPPRYLERREVLGEYALHDCAGLRRALRRRRIDRLATLTPATVGLTEECIKLRLQWLRNLHCASGSSRSTWAQPADLKERVHKLEWGPYGIRLLRGARFRTWHEHYNAACAFALPLQAMQLSPEDKSKLAGLAVGRLEQATARADSAYIGSRRAWLLSEDPDLAGLRTAEEFKLFETMYLPSSDVTPRRPECVQRLESSRYVQQLLVATAERWQATWHARGRGLDTPPPLSEILSWFDDELRIWGCVRDVALQYGHSLTRIGLIDAMQPCADRYGFEPLRVAFPRYEDDPPDDPDSPADKAALREIRKREEQMKVLSQLVPRPGSSAGATLLDDLQQWQATLTKRVALARDPAQWLIAALCDHHAALWQLLGQWLDADAARAPKAQADFERKVRDTRALWCTALKGWRAVSNGLLTQAGRTHTEVLLRYQLRRFVSARRAVENGNGSAVVR